MIIRKEHAMIEARKPLKDPIAHKDPMDAHHATHSAWAGGTGGSVDDENLVMPIDHSKAVGGEAVTAEPEILKLTERQLRRAIRRMLAEAGMPSSVIKHKQTLAAMSDEELVEKYGHKSEEELRKMAWRHGYGRMSPHYLNRVNSGKQR